MPCHKVQMGRVGVLKVHRNNNIKVRSTMKPMGRLQQKKEDVPLQINATICHGQNTIQFLTGERILYYKGEVKLLQNKGIVLQRRG
jgi:hypothetical protein